MFSYEEKTPNLKIKDNLEQPEVSMTNVLPNQRERLNPPDSFAVK